MEKFNLELLAQIVGGSLGLKVRSGGGYAITKTPEGLVVIIPPMKAGDADDAAILRSGLAHEAVGHARHTDFNAKRGPTELHLALENVLEDARIEKAAWKVYPKCRQMLADGMQALLNRGSLRRAATEQDPGSKAAIAILLRLMVQELTYCQKTLDWKQDWAIAEGMGAVHQGVIVQARTVRIEPNNQYVSASLGGLIGAALGNRVSSNSGRGVATAVGSVFGAVVGNAVGGSMGGVTAQELLVRLENGTLISVTQAESRLSPGQPVFLVQSGGKIRVTPKV